MKCQCYGYDYAVIGGDMRQVYLAGELARGAGRVCCYGICADAASVFCAGSLSEFCSLAPCLIGPIPFCKNGDVLNQSVLEQPLPIKLLLSNLKSGQSLFAGCISRDFRLAARKKGVRVFDLMENPQLSYFNTLATAEGAVCEAIGRSPMNLHQSSCAVLGYGKCGCTLSRYLKGMFCHISVVTNSEEERAQASLIADKTIALKEFGACAGEFDFVFNTIPALVVSKKLLAKMKRSVTIIDIASSPGGVDFEAAKELGISAVLCPGLPGKYAPLSSARAIKDIIEKNFERSVGKCL